MSNKTIPTRIQIKRDTSTNWEKNASFKPLAGEIIFYTDKGKIKIGDGITSLNNLPFMSYTESEVDGLIDDLANGLNLSLSTKANINHTHDYLEKTTYEWNKEFTAGSNGAISLGRYNMYDTQLTFDIDSTTTTAISGKLVIATQNGRICEAKVFGDATNTLVPCLQIYQSTISNNRSWIEIFCNFAGRSKNKVHIYGVALNSATVEKQMTSVTITDGVVSSSNITSGDTKWTGTIVNAITSTVAPISHGTHVTAATVKSALETGTGTSKYLREDGTWATPPNTTYNNATSHVAGLMSATDKDNLDTIVNSFNNENANTTIDTIKEVLNAFADAPEETNIVNALATKVDKVSGKGLSTNDLTAALKSNYDAAYNHSQSTHARTDATKVEASTINGSIKINGTETTVYTHPTGTNPHGTTASDVGLGNVGNFKAVSTVASQGLTDTEKSNARTNIGAGTSSFSGNYTDLTNKPAIPSGAAANKNVDKSIFTASTSENLPTSAAVAAFVEGKGYKTTDNDTDAIYSGIAYCDTGAAIATKVATMPKFVLITDQYILLKTTTKNTATSNVTLNVNSTGAKPVKIRNSSTNPTITNFPAGYYLAKYDGTNWILTIITGTSEGTVAAGNHDHGWLSSNGSLSTKNAVVITNDVGAISSASGVTTTELGYIKGLDQNLSTSSLPTFYKVTAESFYATSDRRKKENIKEFSPQKSILELPIVEFNFKDSGDHQIGCIAQDLQEICPEIVSTDSEGYLSINENKIVYLLLDEIKKLKEETNNLKKEILELKK